MAEHGESSKKRRATTGRHKWTVDEEKTLLNYARELFLEGKEFEKPTVTDYYKKFQKATENQMLAEISLDKIIQHMKCLKKTYQLALQFRNTTGEGILATDPEEITNIESKVRQICKYYDDFSELLGGKPQFNPPYIIETYVKESEVLLGDDSAFEELQTADEELVATPEKTTKIDEVVSKRKEEEPKRKRQSPVKNASKAFEAAMRYKCLSEEKRLEWEKQCRNEEKEAQLRIEDLENKRAMEFLNFKKQKWEAKMDLKKKEQEEKYRLEELKIKAEMEFRKFQFERKLELERNKENTE